MKKPYKKTLIVILILVALAAILVNTLQAVHAAEAANTEDVLLFLKDVVKLDVAKYDTKLVIGPITDHPEGYGGLVETHGLFSLSSETNTLEVSFGFINGTLTSCHMYIRDGQPLYSEPKSSNMRGSVSGFLQRYQLRTGDSAVPAMQSILGTVDIAKNSTTISGNLKLDVSIKPWTDTSLNYFFKWSNIYNGAVFSAFGVSFINDDFCDFGDDRSFVQIGSTEVNVPKQEAMSMGLEYAKNFSYTLNGEKIENLSIRENAITAELLTKAKDKPLVLYPYWMVTYPLGDLYPGFVSMIMVEIWADTGKVIDVYPLGIGGGDLPGQSPTAQPSSTPSAEPSQSPAVSASPTPTTEQSTSPSPSQSPRPTDDTVQSASEFPFVVAAAALAAAGSVMAAALFLKKRRKTA